MKLRYRVLITLALFALVVYWSLTITTAELIQYTLRRGR